jgi:hypothetical protein
VRRHLQLPTPPLGPPCRAAAAPRHENATVESVECARKSPVAHR